MLWALLPKLYECEGTFDARTIGNAMYGLNRMTFECYEVGEIVRVLTAKMRDDVGFLDAQSVGCILFGMRAMDVYHPIAQRFTAEFNAKISESSHKLHFTREFMEINLYYSRGMGFSNPQHLRLNNLLDSMQNTSVPVTTLYDEGGDQALYDLLSNSFDDYYPEEEEDLMEHTKKFASAR